MTTPTAFVTGVAGFIGSLLPTRLMDSSNVVVDNLINSSAAAVERAREIGEGKLSFDQFDITDGNALKSVFALDQIDVVAHFAPHKTVGDSINRPLDCYTNNVGGMLTLLNVMRKAKADRLIFYSSCSIHANPTDLPIREASPANPSNPDARSKWMCEQIRRTSA
jgi:UDP-glucose 4-epimerase